MPGDRRAVIPYYEKHGVRLYHGEALASLLALAPASVDALITDPPYSSGGQFRGDRTQSAKTKYLANHSPRQSVVGDFTGDNRDQRSFSQWCALWLDAARRAMVPGAPACVFTDWRQLPTTTDAFQAGGLVWRGIAVWDKTEAARPYLGRFRAQAEFVVWGSNGPMPDRGVGVVAGVVRAQNRRDELAHHLTAKPIEVMKHFVKICTPGGVVLDPFAGSGSTLIAAAQMGRRAIGIELDEANCEIAARRLEALDPATLPALVSPARVPDSSLDTNTAHGFAGAASIVALEVAT